MNSADFIIRAICKDEWLPDRCLVSQEPFDPKAHQRQVGCSSLDWFFTHGSREKLEEIYTRAIDEYGGCGFVTWEADKVVACHTFFPREIAQQIKFFGWGTDEDTDPKTLVHNCITLVRGKYRRRGIGSSLVKHSLQWAKENGWQRFEVHLVLPDCDEGWKGGQKTCRTFWEKLGFQVYRSEEADDETKEIFGVNEHCSMYVALDR